MTKRDILNLLWPSAIVLVIAVTAFFMVGPLHRETASVRNQQKFERFVDDVHSGKQQLTTDIALAIIQQERDTVDSYSKAASSQAGMLQLLGCLALVSIGLQGFVVFSVQKRMRKP